MKLPSRRTRTKNVAIIGGAAVIGALIGVLVWAVLLRNIAPNTTQPDRTPVATNERSEEASKETEKSKDQPPAFNKRRYATNEPSSLWVVVNKQHPLVPLDYVPQDIITGLQGYAYSQRLDADLRAMFAAAARDKVSLQLSSAYRSYANQQTLYANYVAQYGQQLADTISARAGYSEHQTGLAVDIGGVTNPACNFSACFGETPEGRWLAAHVAEYGFIVRYTQANEAVTGYSPEPWHIRYVGKELAAELQRTNARSLEDFFGVPGGSTYKGV